MLADVRAKHDANLASQGAARLRAILRYIAERDPEAADRMERRVDHAVDVLLDAPLIHRPGRIIGTREAVVHPDYIIAYRVRDEQVTTLSILHAHQRYP